MPSEDPELLFAYVRRGDVSALTTLISHHTAWLTAYLRGMLSFDDVDDAFQQVAFRFIKGSASYRGGSVKSYLFTIARSVAIDKIRTSGQTISLDAEDEDGEPLVAELKSEVETPVEVLERTTTAADVYAAMQQLSVRLREVILMRMEGGLSFEEIAATLNIPCSTAKSRARLAVQRLRQLLGGKK